MMATSAYTAPRILTENKSKQFVGVQVAYVNKRQRSKDIWQNIPTN